MLLNSGRKKKMKISQTLRKPANWQDFESLCLLLWRAEWKSDDIKKNGRNGQAQKGVDICGHREGENEYSGIQCKCKPGNKALTTDEIDEEIDNAKAFKPALRRLIFATTADKDAPIEEYIRIKDDENRKNGLFSIDIKSWQDIIDLLELNKSVLHTYLDIVAEDYAVAITFEDGSEETIIHPQYSRIYYMEPAPREEPKKTVVKDNTSLNIALGGWTEQLKSIAAMADQFKPPVVAQAKIIRGTIKTNHSYCPLKFQVVNQGKAPIDDYKIIFHFENENVRFVKDNVEKKTSFPELISFTGIRNVFLENGAGVTMYGNSIIPGDDASSDDFFVRLPYDVAAVNIKWKLLSRQYSCEGSLKLSSDRGFVDLVKYDKEKAGKTYICDYIEEEDII